MTGGYGSRFDPMTVDSDECSSEGDTDDCMLYLPPKPQEEGSITLVGDEDVEDCVCIGASMKSDDCPATLKDHSNGNDGGEDDDCGFVRMKEECHAPPPPATTSSLSPEQQQIVHLVRQGRNVFFSGPGGTGKSFVLHHILQVLKDTYTDPHSPEEYEKARCGCYACNVAVTASTGIAALPIGGSTLHRAAGIGIPRCPNDFNKMWNLRTKWRNLSVLIVDEISMVSAELLDYLEQTISKIRHDRVGAFGGLQVIFAGDFFQLQPIVGKPTQTSGNELLNRGLAFEAPAWHRAGLNMVILKQVFRQEDHEFVNMLNGIRTGENVAAAMAEIVRRCSRPLPPTNGVLPTVLYSKNLDADAHNRQELERLPGEEVVLAAQELAVALNHSSLASSELVMQQLRDVEFWKDCLAPQQLRLKIGAQVMLLWNLELEGRASDLVNGSRGVVVGWRSKAQMMEEMPKPREKPRTVDEFQHKRVYDNLVSSDVDRVPVVRFRNGRVLDCAPESFTHRVLNVGDCTRLQVPLKLAWAITIHKCQGMTLDYAKVSLKDMFAEGQVYVALSRVRSMEGLQVMGTSSHKDVRVNPKVVEFYKALERGEALPPSRQLAFPSLDLRFPGEGPADDRGAGGVGPEAPAETRKRGTSPSAAAARRPQKPFEKCPERVFANTVVACYHCKARGHPASACWKKPRLCRT